MSIIFWISDLINNTILHFLSTTLIGKIISLSENSSIFFITAKMLLMSFTSQISSLLNPISILVWFLIVNATTLAQILPKTSFRFSKHWNLNKISVKLWQDFCCFNEEPPSTKSCSDQFCSHLALPHLISLYLAPPHLITYPILKSLIVPHYIKMHLVLWQLTIQYNYLAHFNQLSFSFPVSFYLIQLSSYPVLFHHHLIWFYSFAEAQPSKEGATVMMSNYMLRNLVEASI